MPLSIGKILHLPCKYYSLNINNIMNFKTLRSLAALIAVTAAGMSATASAQHLNIVSVTPENGSTVESLPNSGIVIKTDVNPDWYDWDNSYTGIYFGNLLDANGNIYCTANVQATADYSAGYPWPVNLNVTLPYNVTSDGTYTLTIPANTFCTDDENRYPNEEWTFRWTIGEAGGDEPADDSFESCLIMPENGSTVDKIGTSDIFVWFPGNVVLTDAAYDDNLLNCVRVKDEKGNVVAVSEILSESYVIPQDRTYFNIQLNNEITEDGTYTFTIPAGVIAPWGAVTPSNAETTVTYTVYNPANNTGFLNLKSVEPAQGEVDTLDNIEVYFDKDCDWDWGLDESAKDFSIYNQDGVAVSSTTFRGVAGGWGSPYYAPFHFPEISAPGTYTLTIPAGCFTQDGDTEVKNKEIVLTWTIADPNQGGGDDDTNCTYDFGFVNNYPAADGSNYDFAKEGGAIDRILVNWEGEHNDGKAFFNPSVKPYIEDANGNRTVSTSASDFMGSTNVFFNSNDTKLWKSGAYTFVIPKGFAGTADWKSSGYKEGNCNPEIRVNFTYVQDPSISDVNNDFELEVSKFGFYNGSTCVVDFLQHPETVPNMTGGVSKKFVFGSNKNEMSMDIYLEVFDVTNGTEEGVAEWIWGAGTYRQQVTSVEDVRTINGKNSDNEFEVEFSNSNFTMEFYQGHQYEVRIGLYKQFDGVPEAQRLCYDTYVARFSGTTKAYEYSPATIVAISKPEGADIASATDGAVTITFSEPMNITTSDNYTRILAGSGLAAYQSVVSNADRTQWTLVPSASTLSGCTGTCDYRFQAKDDEGRTFRSDVYYTSGQKDATYVTISYSCFLGGAAIAVNVPEGEVESLYAFTFTAPSASHKNIGFQGTSASGKLIDIVLKNQNGDIVATMARGESDIVATESGEYNIDCQMHLDKEVTAPGTYTLCVPGAYFMTGTESNSTANKPMEFVYTIPGEVEPPVVEPFVTVTFSVGGNAGFAYKAPRGEEATVAIEGSEDWQLDTLLVNGEDVTLDVAADGVYTIAADVMEKNVALEAEYVFAHEINFEFTTEVSTIEGCAYKVYKDGDVLVIDGIAAGDVVKVYTLNGMMLADLVSSNEAVKISAPNGTYIVMINNVALKVVK